MSLRGSIDNLHDSSPFSAAAGPEAIHISPQSPRHTAEMLPFLQKPGLGSIRFPICKVKEEHAAGVLHAHAGYCLDGSRQFGGRMFIRDRHVPVANLAIITRRNYQL